MKQQTQMQNNLTEWGEVELQDLVEALENGSRPKGGVKHITEGVPSLGAEALNSNGNFNFDKIRYVPKEFFISLKKGVIRKEDILIVKDGATTGKVSFVDEKFPFRESAVNEHVFILRLNNKKCLQKFMFYYLFSKEGNDRLMNNFQGTAQGGINTQFIYNFTIPLPFPSDQQKSLKIQQQIVVKLDAFFEHYNKLKEQKQIAKDNYEKILQSAINSFLIKGDYEKERFGNICIINPSKSEIKDLSEDLEVSFIPMSNVDETEGNIKALEVEKLKDVKKGYTYFRGGDVLFAKITPCMENGKVVIAKNLKNKIGFGSTEFHVIRPNEKILADYIFYFLRQPSFRQEAKMNMTGTAGQLRVPSDFLEDYEIPLPSIEKQKEIVKALNKIKENYKTLLQQQFLIDKKLEQLPKAVLSKAFRGEL